MPGTINDTPQKRREGKKGRYSFYIWATNRPEKKVSDKNDYNEVCYNYLIYKMLYKKEALKRHFLYTYIFLVLVVLSHKYNICCNKLNDIEGIGKTSNCSFQDFHYHLI